MKKYIKILRLDHWIKQLFIIPGILIAIILCKNNLNYSLIIFNLVIGFISTCLIASSNYVINEYLDAQFDKYHPVKKHRSIVENDLSKKIILGMYFFTAVLGLLLSIFVSIYFFLMALWLWIMGIIYNVKPFRSKDIPYLDVLSESINNAIRFLMGWFIITSSFLPPISIVVGYWFAGAFLMGIKRFSEFRMINNKATASKYRKSFKHYSERSLLISSFFYAMLSVFFIGIFLIKYKIELVLFMPFFMGLFCYYFYISFKKDSAAQKPEKLYKEKGLIVYVLFLSILFLLLISFEIPFLSSLLNNELLMLS